MIKNLSFAAALIFAASLTVSAGDLAADVAAALKNTSGGDPAAVQTVVSSRIATPAKISGNKTAEEGSWLSKAQEKLTLNKIDSVCGDTWCEGDFDYYFKSLKCVEYTCSLEFFMWERSAEPVRVYSDASGLADRSPAHLVACNVSGFRKFSDLLEGDGIRGELTQKFYESLTECIGRVEENIDHSRKK